MPDRVALIENGYVTAVLWADAPILGETVDCPEGNDVEAGWRWDGIGFVPPPVTPSAAKTLFDGAEFLTRLTDAEYGAILAASTQSIQLARWLDTFRLRGEIDVTGKTALAAKYGLVKTGLLTPERADAIFASG